jgi:UDP-GlcNAc:undecaprenyl-phosphate GlcNAc-1-phosphate transferase
MVSLIIGMFIALGANLGGRLFLGDAGTYGIGAFIGLATIWIHRSNIGLYTIDVVVMFMIPVLDMARLFVFRILAGRHPFSADHEHLHHYLDKSIGWAYGRKIYYALVACPIIFSKLQIVDPLVVLLLGFALYLLTIVVGYRVDRA